MAVFLIEVFERGYQVGSPRRGIPFKCFHVKKKPPFMVAFGVLWQQYFQSCGENPVFQVLDSSGENFPVGVRRGGTLDMDFYPGRLAFPNSFFFNVATFARFHRQREQLKYLAARLAIAIYKCQLAIERISVRSHVEHATGPGSVTDRNKQDRALVDAIVPFDFRRPLRIVLDAKHRRHQVADHSFDPGDALLD